MGKSEKAIMNEVLLDVSKWDDAFVYRNNTGSAWQGERVSARPGTKITIEDGMVILKNGRPITFGLPGSGDIMGCVAGRPLAIEVKAEKGRQSEQQQRFQAAWERAGGVYLLTRSVEETQKLWFDALLK